MHSLHSNLKIKKSALILHINVLYSHSFPLNLIYIIAARSLECNNLIIVLVFCVNIIRWRTHWRPCRKQNLTTKNSTQPQNTSLDGPHPQIYGILEVLLKRTLYGFPLSAIELSNDFLHAFSYTRVRITRFSRPILKKTVNKIGFSTMVAYQHAFWSLWFAVYIIYISYLSFLGAEYSVGF